MKILHLCQFPLVPDHPDYQRIQLHPGRWVLHLAKAQKKHTDLEPELLVQVPGASQNFTTKVDGIPVHYLAAPAQFRSATFFWFDQRRINKQISHLNPTLVHAHGTEDAYSLTAQSSGLPYVITAQGLFFLMNSVMQPSFISRDRVIEFLERKSLLQGKHVITKSDYVRKHIHQAFPHLQLHSIPNTYDPEFLNIQEKREEFTIIFVGTIIPRKGVHLIREAMAKVMEAIPHVRLWIVGNRENSYTDYEANEKAALKQLLGDRIIFHGTRSLMETSRLIARSTLLVAPSLEEMFGNQVIESLLVKTPVIVTENTAMAENVEKFGNGRIIPQNNPHALASAITEMLKSPPPDAEEARKAVMTELSPQRVAGLHLELYSKIS